MGVVRCFFEELAEKSLRENATRPEVTGFLVQTGEMDKTY
jgi:hypothetical protein